MSLTSKTHSFLFRSSPRPQFFIGILVVFFIATLTLSVIHLDVDADYSSTIYETSAEIFRHLYSSSAEKPPPSGIGGLSDNVQLIPHLHAEGFPPSTACALHNLPQHSSLDMAQNIRIIDAVIVDSPGNVEDLLELRMEEGAMIVDKFFIVEFATTRDGNMKRDPIQPKKNKRFKNFWPHIEYRFISSDPNSGDSSESNLERRQGLVDKLVKSHIHELHPDIKVIVLTSTAEQIFRRSTLRLFESCKFPATGMKKGWVSFTEKYLYSFEFNQQADPLTPPDTYVRTWKGGGSVISPSHADVIGQAKEEWLLPDGGWQCDHCYRRVQDYIPSGPPLQSPTEPDESNENIDTQGSQENADENDSQKDTFNLPSSKGVSKAPTHQEQIQNNLCNGRRIAGFEPSSRGKVVKRASATMVMRRLLENWNKYRFLLPGGCLREDSN